MRNLPDGDVEALAEGAPAAIEAFVRWCNHGPSQAQVESIKLVDELATGEFTAFEVVR